MPPQTSQFHTVTRETFARNPSDKQFEYPALQTLTYPHLKSFNAITECCHGDSAEDGLSPGLIERALEDIGQKVVFDGKPGGVGGYGNKLSMWVEEVQIGRPAVSERDTHSVNRLMFPSECRERLVNYAGRLMVKLCWRVNNGPVQTELKQMGMAPIMVKSNLCNIEKFSPRQLIDVGEECEEMGGYFIVNGLEKIIRLLIVNRRNHVMAVVRPSYANRGPSYTPYGCQIRSVRPDETSATVGLNYLSDGQVMFRFSWRKQEFLVPVLMIIKSLVDTSDMEIFQAILREDFDNTFVTDRVELMLRKFKNYELHTREQCLAYLGDKFRVVMNQAEDVSDVDVGKFLLQKVVLVHLKHNRDKFNMLAYMIRKLYALVSGECAPDNPDSPQHQEVLLGGFLYAGILKEKLEDWLNGIRMELMRDVRRNPASADFLDRRYLMKIIGRVPSDIGQKLHYFLATGNLVSSTGMDMQQTSGYTIVAEKLNFLRYLSHFRCIHRGSFFAELKTTTVRKLLPEAWGFLCPVHTPDGTPCGLLNHLSHSCKVLTYFARVDHLPRLLASLGVSLNVVNPEAGDLSVQLDGRLIGWCSPKLAERVARELRHWKVTGQHDVPLDLEIGYVPPSNRGQYPGLYLFASPARMMRPVRYLAADRKDMVGSFEQVYMEIACMDDEVDPKTSTHQEYTPTNILSVVANLTPFSDFNQSPRNMYQCQMGKQTMGTPAQAIAKRTDNKLYRLQTGQTPIVRPKLHDSYGIDGFPNGMNAVVAVISYTGYDMEDAMILNKSGHERGFGYGTVYKSEVVDLADARRRGEATRYHFGLGADTPRKVLEKLDLDGLPFIGIKLRDGDPMCAYVDDVTGRTIVKKFKGLEDGYVDQVRLLGSDAGDKECQKVHIRFRITRSPIIGDKFSSRHGQKGVCSQKWPSVDMPWTESGIQPDVIINPHAFPSRMTIGMFVESLAGKSGALHGIVQDSTPFQFNEQHTAADYFGEQLAKAGYNYHGNEPMYSGITGEELRVDIYIGVVYYQRLRHMVSDKYQVRTTGPVHVLTQQPLKGRKRAGGIRFGEMERDSLLAHGVSFLLQDRLMNCSDYTQTHVCKRCRSIVSPAATAVSAASTRRTVQCRICERDDAVVLIAVPYVFRYLATELMAMNIRLDLAVN
ncbi:hypothetical protein THASP1DRAFT_34361 [Thamnocephalis sphaerospora]|uniref:DNA-directed RNA polymerase subunit beta n=1 Tax=Thamnocephalis sphaerospora TaxID=78915 RepID=A0A4P9XVF5_9FUNG|nr:hypothetical protein THASP1DRAFT_34361 [Thamnocephalis sphaerospora]|eukprot:RKP09581.1 hypothetical protein THASP1DRAFT_34361 [Thamnocephalis sphaerospora]